MTTSAARRIGLIVNRKAGSARRIKQLAQVLISHQLTPEVFEAGDPAEAAGMAIQQGANVLVAAGGDGTLSSVASAIIGTDAVLAVLPLGTRNHFAKALGLPLALEQAVEVIGNGSVSAVDVGEVNGRIFLNNSSLGLYPLMVVLRRRQEKLGLRRWIAQLWAGCVSLARMPVLEITLAANGERVHRRTPMIFIGNNRYEFEGTRVGDRDSLTEGELFLTIVNGASRMRFLRLTWLALLGKLHDRSEFEAFPAKEAVVECRRGVVRVSLDGEVVLMKPPLRYRILPKSLKVLTP